MEIHIWNDFQSGTIKILVTQNHSRGRAHWVYTSEGINLIEHKMGERISPFIELPEDIFNEMVKEFMRYGSEKGIQTENENVVTGKLIATEKHLDHSNMNLDKLIDFIVKTKK